MTTSLASLNTGEEGTPGLTPSLADVLTAIPSLDGISDQTRQNLASAIRTFGRVLDREPQFVPIAAPVLRRAFEQASPGAIGLSPSRWGNVKADVRRAVTLSGLSTAAVIDKVPLTGAWETVVQMEAHPVHRSMLTRFARFCCSVQVPPTDVNDQVMGRFFHDLDTNQLSKTPERIVRDTVRFWNRAIATDPSGQFVELSRRAQDRTYTPTWNGLPRSLYEDAKAFHDASVAPRTFKSRVVVGTVRPVSADQYDRMVRRLAAAEIHAGVDIGTLQSLADLVRPSNLEKGLEFFLARPGGKAGRQPFDMAMLAMKIARDWARLAADEVAKIVEWTKALRYRQDGMTEKNRERLRQFANPEAIRSLLTLPDVLSARALSQPLAYKSAMQMQKAVAIAILLAAPIRLNNLRQVDRHLHLRRAFSVDVETWELVVPAREVKNSVELHLPMPKRVTELIDLYMSDYQPLLTGNTPCSLLFPGRTGNPKDGGGLSALISKTIKKELGLRVNTHLFRHFAAYVFLTSHPGEFETVRQLLGHRSLQTTVNFYASFESEMAGRRYNEVLQALRGDTGGDLWRRQG